VRYSTQYRYVDGQLQRAKKPKQVRGLNQNHNHVMKEIFKGAALKAALWFPCYLEPTSLASQLHEPNASNHHRKHETDEI
jgi:hypothetical protein